MDIDCYYYNSTTLSHNSPAILFQLISSLFQSVNSIFLWHFDLLVEAGMPLKCQNCILNIIEEKAASVSNFLGFRHFYILKLRFLTSLIVKPPTPTKRCQMTLRYFKNELKILLWINELAQKIILKFYFINQRFLTSKLYLIIFIQHKYLNCINNILFYLFLYLDIVDKPWSFQGKLGGENGSYLFLFVSCDVCDPGLNLFGVLYIYV